MREGLAWLFDSRGHKATTWDSGPPFIDSVKARAGVWEQAVVLLDIRMVPMTGLQVFEQLKALACPWPVLFLTGNGDVGTAVAAVKNGAWDFLEKPFQDNVLVDRVEQALAELAKQPDPDLDADILDRPIGGLGVHLIRELAEDVSYRREEPHNVLTVVLISTPHGSHA